MEKNQINLKTIATITLALCLLSTFCGCVDKSSGTETKKEISPLHIENNSILGQLPVELAPFLTYEIVKKDLSVEFENISITDQELSNYSSRIAISFWNSSNRVYVVDSYENAMRASSLAAIDGCPILFWGNTSENVIKKLNSSEIIGMGNLPIGKYTQILADNSDVINYVIERELPIYGYLSIVNSNSSDPASALSPLFNALRGGLIITVNDSDAAYVHNTIFSAIDSLNATGMKIRHVAIFGGAESIDYYKTHFTIESSTGSFEEQIYTDNYYGCHVVKNIENLSTPGIAIGRIVAPSITSAQIMYEKYANYEKTLGEWTNNATIFNADLFTEIDPNAGYGAEASMINMNNIFLNAQYQTYTSTALMTLALRQNLLESMANSNFIYSVFSYGTDVVDLFSEKLNLMPCVIFDCTSIEKNNISDQKESHYALLAAGACTYVAPLLHSWIGSHGEITANSMMPIEESNSLQLAKRFFSELISNNKTVGMALNDAKKSYSGEMANPDGIYIVVSTSFTLYGDPAFNPYEPCNEGAK
jgi:hypothetical protein